CEFQPVQLLKSTDLGRHSLLYIKEMGQGWFGKVLLGEVNAGLSTTQVVVKELKASASVQEQMQFLEEVQPYRVLQHPALLQCLSQCSEVTPFLLVMEHCSLGDVKGYLLSCRAADSMTPDPLILQRMACEIASGLLYLHKHNYIHSDLALRNCLLTSELAVKIGNYGLSHSKYKDDYYVTADQIWVPLRWIAPELIDEVHGNLLVVDQTKTNVLLCLMFLCSNFFFFFALELGNQPYRHYSDRQVLTYAVKEQQLKLPKPLLKVPLCERWYEVMQFCWLQPEQRPVVEEVHLLLSYLCAKGATEAEEDFEKRWNSLRPSLGSSSSHRTPAPEVASSTSSSFPLLEHFSLADSFQSENGDDMLTVTETSQGLNFEYKWEQARAEQPYCSSSPVESAKEPNSNDYDSDSSLNMEPLQRRVPSSVEINQSEVYFSSNDRHNLQCEQSPQAGPVVNLIRGHGSDSYQQRRGSGSLCHRLEVVKESPLGVSVSLSSPSLAHCDPYLESNQRTVERSMNMLTNWNSNHSANNNSLSDHTQAVGFRDAYLDLRHPTPSSQVGNLKSRALKTSNSCTYYSIDSLKDSYMEATESMPTASKPHADSEGENVLLETRISPAQKLKLGTDGSAGVCVKMVSCPIDLSKTVSECSHLTDCRMVPDNSSISLVEINDCSNDCMDTPSGVLADYTLDYAEVGNIDLTHRTLQRETGSRHCEDTINLASSSSPCEAFSPDSYHTSIQPKSLDSGYDTENNESPEFILKDLEGNPALSTSVESDECDMLLQMDLDEDVNVMLLHPSSSHLPLISLGERNQYRDSAYFSDYDMENDKSPSEGDDAFDLKAEKEGSEKTFGREGRSMESEKGNDISVPKDNSAALNDKQLCLKKTNPNFCPSPASVPMISMLSPFPPEMGGCLTKESTPDDGIGLESDHSGEEPNSECYSSAVSEGSSSTQEASGVEEQVNGDTREFSSAESLALPEDLDVPAPLGNGEEADEEDSEDSDESDEELCSYSIQEQSDESDEEFPVVPVVVSDRSSARHLRGLLKMPSLLTQSFCDELESKKKAVSFFDDVTVFLFDQESPTGELGDYCFPVDEEPNSQASEVELPQPQDRVTTTEESPGRNVSEESGAFQWQDDFPLIQSPSTSEPSSEEIATPPNSPVKSPDEKPAPPLSRFSVSRFSITHVSDSDMDSIGGQFC
uniref:non-specific serine/threonine protein kinase n=1 Tax=Sinocyclocheilus anshuiensis TaxID=1608454 RepID=A0A671RAB4_9TELE